MFYARNIFHSIKVVLSEKRKSLTTMDILLGGEEFFLLHEKEFSNRDWVEKRKSLVCDILNLFPNMSKERKGFCYREHDRLRLPGHRSYSNVPSYDVAGAVRADGRARDEAEVTL